MKVRKKKTRPLIKVVKTKTQQDTYKKFVWNCIMSILFLAGNLVAFLKIFDGIKFSKIIVIFMAFLGIALAMITQYFSRKIQAVIAIRFVPVIILLISGPLAFWEGMRLWLNQIIIGWNHLQHSGMVLFAGDASHYSVMVFLIVTAMILGEIIWIMISNGKTIFSCFYALFWIFVMLAGNRFEAISVALFLSALFGINMFGHNSEVRKNGIVNFIVIFGTCMIGALLLSNGKLNAIENARHSVAHSIHELRYGKDQFPEGDLKKADQLQKSKQEMMQIIPEDKKTLYLKAYVGTFYENGKWKKMPDSVYGGENAGLMRWLKSKNFDPLTQSATYQQLSEKNNSTLSKNHVKIEINKASRYYFYTPDSFYKIINGNAKNNMDMGMVSKGFFGQRKYEWTEVSSTKPSELTVADEWVSNPKNKEQRQYSEAEAVYRKFVYDNYTKPNPQLTAIVKNIFWKDYDSKSDGIYSALNQVRTKLKKQYTYIKKPKQAPQGEDPIDWFLQTSHEGNQMLYTSAAVEAFRVHGIPARYVEGYYLGASKIESSVNGKVAITGQNAHAWVEVYFDGVGWKAIDVTPGYYYDVARLQKMVHTPDQVKKNAALKKNNGYKGKQTADSGKSKKNVKDEVKKTVKNVVLLMLGVLALLIIIVSMIFLLFQIKLWMIEKNRKKQYEQADMNEKIRILQKEIYKMLMMFGIEAKLGWKTKEIDKLLSEHFEEINEGDYERVSALMEKTIYGDIELELFEERTLRVFRDKLRRTMEHCSWKKTIRKRKHRI